MKEAKGNNMGMPYVEVSGDELNNQEYCCFWCKGDERIPIGKVFSRTVMTAKGMYTLVWQGSCMGEEVKATSIGDAEAKMTKIAMERNIPHVVCDKGYGIDTIYTPAFEE